MSWSRGLEGVKKGAEGVGGVAKGVGNIIRSVGGNIAHLISPKIEKVGDGGLTASQQRKITINTIINTFQDSYEATGDAIKAIPSVLKKGKDKIVTQRTKLAERKTKTAEKTTKIIESTKKGVFDFVTSPRTEAKTVFGSPGNVSSLLFGNLKADATSMGKGISDEVNKVFFGGLKDDRKAVFGQTSSGKSSK